MTLTIDGVGLPSGNEFIGLDNVSVAPAVIGAVPEAETYALLLAGHRSVRLLPAIHTGPTLRSA